MILVNTDDFIRDIKAYLSDKNREFSKYDKNEILNAIEKCKGTIITDVYHLTDDALYALKEALEDKISIEASKDKIRLVKISREYGFPCYVMEEKKEIVKAVILKLLEEESLEEDFSDNFRIKTEIVLLDENKIPDLEYDEGYGLIDSLSDVDNMF